MFYQTTYALIHLLVGVDEEVLALDNLNYIVMGVSCYYC